MSGRPCASSTARHSRPQRGIAFGLLAGDGVDGLPRDGHGVVGEALVVAGQQRDVDRCADPVRPASGPSAPRTCAVQLVHRVVVGVQLDGQHHVAGAHDLGRLERELHRDRPISAKSSRTSRGQLAGPARRTWATCTREVAHPLDVARGPDRRDHGAQVAGDGAVEQQGVGGELLDLGAQRVDRRSRPRSPARRAAPGSSSAAVARCSAAAAAVHICPSSSDSSAELLRQRRGRHATGGPRSRRVGVTAVPG